MVARSSSSDGSSRCCERWRPSWPGANRYPWGRFVAFNAAGGIVWATLYGSAAYLLGHSIHRMAGPFGITLLFVALVVGGLAWRYLRRHQAQLQAEANAAIPRPLRSVATP